MSEDRVSVSAENAGPTSLAERTLPGLIVQRAAEHPARPAIVSGTSALSYGELVDMAGELAGRLRLAGTGRGEPVASLLPRGLALASSVLGIWLAHGAYVPVDPDGPPARAGRILADSGARTVIAGTNGKRPPEPERRRVILVDERGAVKPGGTASANGTAGAATDSRPGSPELASDDLAYIMYTSGSTGMPKGVLVEHGSLAAMAASHERLIYAGELNVLSRVALNSVPTTDTFFSDFASLAFGRTLFVVDELTRRDPDRLARFITGAHIEVLDATPSQVRAMATAGRLDALESLRILILGGEAIDPELWAKLRTLRDVRVFNLYGPTECTVDVTAAVVSEHESPVIGTEFPGCRVLVADEAGRPLPDGHIGELWVAGPWVARGYLRAAPPDAARFTSVSLGDGRPPVRAYRTGDVGRRNAADQLEYLGRTDDQVNIDGYRVELGEVRAALRNCAGVKDAVVGVRREPQPALVAWVVLADDTSQRAVRTELASVLPRQAVPTLISVPAVPAAGADGTGEEGVTVGEGEDGTGEEPGIPEVIRAIWCNVLKVNSVGDGDDFFDLGGNSLKGTAAVVAIRDAVADGLPVRTIFDFPEFGSFCEAVTGFVSARGIS